MATLEIAVFKSNNQIFAVENHCPHTGGPLVLGDFREGWVACPWHGRRFNLSTGAPECSSSPDRIRSFPVEVDRESILVQVIEGDASNREREL